MEAIRLTDPDVCVRIVRSSRARRFTLRLEAAGSGAVLTVPPFVPQCDIRSFLDRHAGWLRRAMARQPARVVVQDGAHLPVAGQMVRIEALPGRKAPHLDGDVLRVGRSGAVGKRVAAWLKLRARDALQPAASAYAAQLGRQVARLALRDTRSRWGSCSTTGTLSFSWRLAMAPPDVLDYVAAHEAAHLVQMNHSPAYWALVARLKPGWKAQRDWLRRHGRDLHAYRFDGQSDAAPD